MEGRRLRRRGKLADHREQDALLLQEVRFQVGAQVDERGVDLGKLAVPIAVHRLDFVDEALQVVELDPKERVVRGLQVVDELADPHGRPVGGIRLAHLVERGLHLGWVDAPFVARGGKRRRASAAEVEPEPFQHPRRVGVGGHEIGEACLTDGSGHGHLLPGSQP
ncbi:MAG: hypothetical protein V9E99_09080 [Microthrixaceae bacterium]